MLFHTSMITHHVYDIYRSLTTHDKDSKYLDYIFVFYNAYNHSMFRKAKKEGHFVLATDMTKRDREMPMHVGMSRVNSRLYSRWNQTYPKQNGFLQNKNHNWYSKIVWNALISNFLMPAFMISIDFLIFMMSQWPQQMAGVSPSMISKFTLVRPSSSTCLPWGSSSRDAFDFCFFNRNPKCLSSLDLYDLFECTVSSRNTYWHVVLFYYVINSCFWFSNYLASQYTKKNI